jgi:hypothetical protein
VSVSRSFLACNIGLLCLGGESGFRLLQLASEAEPRDLTPVLTEATPTSHRLILGFLFCNFSSVDKSKFRCTLGSVIPELYFEEVER